MTYGIDKDGNPIYRIEKNQKQRTKTIKNEDGSESIETWNPDTIIEDQTPEQRGWQKIVRFEDIVLLRIPDPSDYYKLKPTLFHRVYELSVKDLYRFDRCNFCDSKGYGSKYHYLRVMPSGVFGICWCVATRYGRSAYGMIRTIENREGKISPYLKLISEKKVTKEEAISILKRLDKIPSVDVTLYLGDSELFSF